MEKIVKTTIIFSSEEVYSEIIKQESLNNNPKELVFKVEGNQKEGFTLIARKPISSKVIDQTIANLLKENGEIGNYDIKMENTRFVCREKVEGQKEEVLGVVGKTLRELTTEGGLFYEDSGQLLPTRIYNCLHYIGSQHIGLSLKEYLENKDKYYVRNFGNVSKTEFAAYLKTLDVDEFLLKSLI